MMDYENYKKCLFRYLSVKSVVIKTGVTSIGAYAFCGCTSLTSVTIPNSVTSIEYRAFDDCTRLTSVTIPNSVTSIGECAFWGCESLTSITIPDSVTSIGGSAFEVCDSLTSVTIPNSVTSIGDWTFYFCESLTSVTIGNSVTSIGGSAFECCTNLTSVTIPNSVTSIGAGAFCCCKRLTSVTIPDSVTSIGDRAFEGCNNLTIYGKKSSYAQTYASKNGIKFVAGHVPLSNLTSVSADEITVGNTVTVNCAASGGTAPYQYNVIYKKSSSDKWTTVQKYSSNTTLTFTPAAAVSYDIKVKAKDAAGKVMSKTFTVKVNKKLTNTSKLGAESIKKGEKVKVRCFAEGGVGEYQYAVYYKKASSSKWTTLRGYGTSNIIMLKPAAAVKYDVRVDIKDKSGMVVSKTLTLTVTK